MKTVVTQPGELREHLKYFMDQDSFAFDVEAVGEYRGVPHKNTVTWLSMATHGRGIAIPFGHPNGDVLITPARKKLNRETNTFTFFPPVWSDPPEQMRPGQVFDILHPLFMSEDITKVAQNAPYDLISLYKYLGNQFPAPPYRDTLVEQWLLDENILSKKLKDMLRKYYGWDYDKDNTGRQVEIHPFKKVAHYGYMDAKGTWLLDKDFVPRIKDQGLWDIFQLEMRLLPVLLKMQITGIPVDEKRLHELDEKLSSQIIVDEHKIYDAAGRQFNIGSPKQRTTILYGDKKDGNQGLKPQRLTKGGFKKMKAGKDVTIHDYSTDSDALDLYPGNKVVKALTTYAETKKVLSTYVKGYLGDPDEGRPCRIYDGRIHAEFVQSGTVTGRFSCVAGDTILPTSRGEFRFDEYQPREGDLVITHWGNWAPVLRKIYKGRNEMFRVGLSNGRVIKCTQEHRLLSSYGWKSLGELSVGDSVRSYVNLEELYTKSRERAESFGILSVDGETNDSGGVEAARNYLPQRTWNSQTKSWQRGIESRASATLFSFEDIQAEPDVPKEWFPAPQLQGDDSRWSWLLADKSGQEVRSTASTRNGSSVGDGEITSLARRSSHRRGQTQQRLGQLSAGNQSSSWEASFEDVTIREITSLGTMEVWDIEVAGDHSYAAEGFLNHNCREPNLQNIPTPDSELGKQVRGLFVAPAASKLIVADYGQIELVILASFCGSGRLYDGFHAGIDAHTATAASVFGVKPEDVTKHQRGVAKALNFAIVYGAGDAKVALMAKITVRQAKEFLEKHKQLFPEIYRYKKQVIQKARQQRPPGCTTLLGRKRRVPSIMASDFGARMRGERQLFNSLIQGSAADIIKLAMVRLDDALPDSMQLVLTVHDELVTIVPNGEVETGISLVREAMEGLEISSLLRVPPKADIKVVDRWSEAK